MCVFLARLNLLNCFILNQLRFSLYESGKEIKGREGKRRVQLCCRKGDPFQVPRVGSRLTLGNELSEETHVLTKQETLLGRGARGEGKRVRGPRRTALSCGSQSRVLW